MLFVFDEPGRYPFWMQNCLIPIDIIWLDAAGKVVQVAAAVPPCRLAACDPPCASNQCPSYGGDGLAKSRPGDPVGLREGARRDGGGEDRAAEGPAKGRAG